MRTDDQRRRIDGGLLYDLLNREAPVVKAAILVQSEHLLMERLGNSRYPPA